MARSAFYDYDPVQYVKGSQSFEHEGGEGSYQASYGPSPEGYEEYSQSPMLDTLLKVSGEEERRRKLASEIAAKDWMDKKFKESGGTYSPAWGPAADALFQQSEDQRAAQAEQSRIASLEAESKADINRAKADVARQTPAQEVESYIQQLPEGVREVARIYAILGKFGHKGDDAISIADSFKPYLERARKAKEESDARSKQEVEATSPSPFSAYSNLGGAIGQLGGASSELGDVRGTAEATPTASPGPEKWARDAQGNLTRVR